MKLAIFASLLMTLAWVPVARADVLFVDVDASGGNTGSSWSDAYVDLQDALGMATAGDEIWVAEGTYFPTLLADRTATFSVPNGVELYGGFSGAETERDDRDWDTYETILSGDLGLPIGEQSNSDYIVSLIGTDSTTAVDGVTIRDGRHGLLVDGGNPRITRALITANRSYGGEGAGALIRNGARPAFYDVQFIDNRTGSGFGGGIRCLGSGTYVTLEHVLFEDNHGGNSGGGMDGNGDFNHVEFRGNRCDDFGGGLNGGGKLTNVLFIDNQSNMRGAGMYGRGVLENVQFVGNYQNSIGGGLAGGGQLRNVLFLDNQAPFGAGMYDASGGSELINVVFAGNSAALTGSSLMIGRVPPLWDFPNPVTPAATRLVNVTVADRNSWLVPTQDYDGHAIISHLGAIDVINSVIWGAVETGDPLPPVAAYGAEVSVTASLIRGSGGSGVGWHSAFGIDLGGNLDEDPLFADPGSADYSLSPGSPAIDAGITGAVPAGVVSDLAGNPRFMNHAVDMGAYEADGPLSIEDLPSMPAVRQYVRIAPNPFNPSATIYFGLERATRLTVTVYDLAGRRVNTLRSGFTPAGDHEVQWHGQDAAGREVASGVYLCRVQGEDFVETQRMVLVK